MKSPWWTSLFLGVWFTVGQTGVALADEESEQQLGQWLEKQTGVKTWSAEFTQTRKIPALVNPLITEGKVYYSAPASFRWEIGQPAKTVALRSEDEVIIFYPLLERVERYSMDSSTNDPWKDALSLLDAGFPKSRGELERKFELEELLVSGEVGILVLRPKKKQIQKFLITVELRFNPNEPGLLSAMFEFGDGTVLTNNFKEGETDKDINPSLFEVVDIDSEEKGEVLDNQ